MQRQNYVVELALPRNAGAAMRTRSQVQARRRVLRDLIRRFEMELQPLRIKDPALHVRKRGGAVLPLFTVNTLPSLRKSIEQLKSVRHIGEVPDLRLIG